MNISTNSPQVWEEIKKEVKSRVGESVFDVWFNPIHIKQTSQKSIVLEVPDAFFKDWVVEHYLGMLKEVYRNASGVEADFDLVINPALYEIHNKSHLSKFKVVDQSEKKRASLLNPKYTLDNFVVGSSNRFAHAASMAVAESPAKVYNPFFIYGGVGLGKTHLLQSICHHVQKKFPGQYKIHYTSSETFTNELIDAIQHRQTAKFRQKYRNNLGILVIDDIQFIAGKESTQEEFFHTFNALYDNHKQIIISSDRSPKEISHLEERLISRFGWGLITDVSPPDFELRVAILKKKIEKEPVDIPDAVIQFIAQTVKTNIRELEGALIRIIAYALIEEKPVSLDLTREVLKDFVKETKKIVGVDDILKQVSVNFGVSLSDLKASKRQRNIVFSRQVAMYLTRELTNYSLPEIGRHFGGKDHTTVLYACDKIKKAIAKNSFLNAQVNQIIQNIKQ